MNRIVVLMLLLLAGPAVAQSPPAQPEAPARPGLWQQLTPDQRGMLWRNLTPEQKSDVWRGLRPEERRAMRERFFQDGPEGVSPRRMPHQMFRGEDDGGRRMMSPEERLRMREQIREAHRMRRERMEAERRGQRGGQ